MSTKRKSKQAAETAPAVRSETAPAVLDATAPAVRAETTPAVDVPPELEAVAQALGVELGAGSDLFAVQGDTRAQAFAALVARSAGHTWSEVYQATGADVWRVTAARRQSATYTALMDRIEDARRLHAVAKIEDVLTTSAAGEAAKRQGYYAPDVRAAQLYLAASSERYRPGTGAAVPSVAIQINL